METTAPHGIHRLQLIGSVSITGEIELITGLLIGGIDTFGIGGIDKRMIANQLKNGLPYIPGSSLKGKLRSLLELKYKGANGDGKPISCPDPACMICRAFGAPEPAHRAVHGPTRLIVRDAELVPDHPNMKRFHELTGRYTEVKAENWIKRTEGVAGSPRFFERVPAGAMFGFEMAVRVFSIQTGEGGPADNGQGDLACLPLIKEGMELLQQDYLGGQGSRGYGRVAFRNVTVYSAPDVEERWFQAGEQDEP